MFLGDQEKLVDKHTLRVFLLSDRLVELEIKGVEFYTKKGLTWFVMNVESKGIEIARRNADLDTTEPKFRPHISTYVK